MITSGYKDKRDYAREAKMDLHKALVSYYLFRIQSMLGFPQRNLEYHSESVIYYFKKIKVERKLQADVCNSNKVFKKAIRDRIMIVKTVEDLASVYLSDTVAVMQKPKIELPKSLRGKRVFKQMIRKFDREFFDQENIAAVFKKAKKDNRK